MYYDSQALRYLPYIRMALTTPEVCSPSRKVPRGFRVRAQAWIRDGPAAQNWFPSAMPSIKLCTLASMTWFTKDCFQNQRGSSSSQSAVESHGAWSLELRCRSHTISSLQMFSGPRLALHLDRLRRRLVGTGHTVDSRRRLQCAHHGRYRGYSDSTTASHYPAAKANC